MLCCLFFSGCSNVVQANVHSCLFTWITTEYLSKLLVSLQNCWFDTPCSMVFMSIFSSGMGVLTRGFKAWRRCLDAEVLYTDGVLGCTYYCFYIHRLFLNDMGRAIRFSIRPMQCDTCRLTWNFLRLKTSDPISVASIILWGDVASGSGFCEPILLWMYRRRHACTALVVSDQGMKREWEIETIGSELWNISIPCNLWIEWHIIALWGQWVFIGLDAGRG